MIYNPQREPQDIRELAAGRSLRELADWLNVHPEVQLRPVRPGRGPAPEHLEHVRRARAQHAAEQAERDAEGREQRLPRHAAEARAIVDGLDDRTTRRFLRRLLSGRLERHQRRDWWFFRAP